MCGNFYQMWIRICGCMPHFQAKVNNFCPLLVKFFKKFKHSVFHIHYQYLLCILTFTPIITLSLLIYRAFPSGEEMHVVCEADEVHRQGHVFGLKPNLQSQPVYPHPVRGGRQRRCPLRGQHFAATVLLTSFNFIIYIIYYIYKYIYNIYMEKMCIFF